MSNFNWPLNNSSFTFLDRIKLSLFAPFGQRMTPVSGSPRLESYPQYLVVTRNLMAKFVLIAIGTKRSEEASHFNTTHLSPISKC